MKILYYSPHPNLNLAAPSGPGTHMREVIAAFERQGHEVIPLILGGTSLDQESSIKFSESRLKKIVKAILPETVWQSYKDWRLRRFDRQVAEKRLKQKVAEHNPELIYERAYYLMTSGVKVAKSTGIRHILEMNAPYPEEKMEMEGVSFFLNKANTCEYEQVSMSDKVAVVSSALKDYLEGRYPESASKIIVTPNAVNPEKMKADPTRVGRLKKELGYDDSTVCIGFVGSIFPYHGVRSLLEVYSTMVKGNPSLRLLIVGDGAILPDLRQFVIAEGIQNQVKFTGNVRHLDVANYISLMDVTVMPRSNWYGSPVKIFEYGLLKKAIIAPDNIPVRDVMQNGEDGMLISKDNSDLRTALETLLNDSELRHKLAENFHRKVLEEYNWDEVVRKVLADA